MASTSEGRRLTEQHRRAQQGVRAEFLAQFVALWALLDSTRLDETSPAWVSAVLRLIHPFRERSAGLSVNYFLEFRAVEAPPLEVPEFGPTPGPSRPSPTRRIERAQGSRPQTRTPSLVPRPQERRVRFEFDESAFQPAPERRVRIDIPDIDWAPSDRAARVSLTVTGPVSQKAKAARGKPLERARDESFVESSGAASRHVLTGGRQSLLTLLEDDPQALGWARVTDGDPCAFCSMLAGRGPVYGSAAVAGFKAHDACACTAEPVYSRQAPWPGRAREFQKLWGEVVGFAPNNRYSGDEAVRAYRRAYEQRQRDARRGQVA